MEVRYIVKFFFPSIELKFSPSKLNLMNYKGYMPNIMDSTV